MRIDALRTRYGLSPFEWTDASLVPGMTDSPFIKAVQIKELRDAVLFLEGS